MTIGEAIKTSKEILGSDRLHHWPEAEAATKLGLKALEAYKAGRDSDHYFYYPMLPGETEEGER